MAVPLTLEEIAQHPEADNAIPYYEPVLRSTATVAHGRSGGPISISYEIYGHGPIRIVWILGLGAPKIAWHRQTEYFGVDRGDRFTCLVFDNRGMGESSVPWARYTTKEMAKDTLELCDHLGWNGRKQLHVVGVSMGGMISQELAYAAPDRVASLTLQSSAARLVPTTPWYQHLASRINIVIPKSPAARLAASKYSLFSDRWLAQPDELGVFPTNGDRYAAEDLWKRKYIKVPTFKGFLSQALAASGHHMDDTRLKALGSGIEHVLVCAGTADRMIDHSHSEVLAAGIAAGGRRVTKRYFDGVGHILNWEVCREYNQLVEEFLIAAADATSSGQ